MGEKDQLGADYTYALNKLAQQTTQMGGGFYQLTQDMNYEDVHPSEIDSFVQSKAVKDLSEDAGITPDDLRPPMAISDEIIDQIDGIVRGVDPLEMTENELEALRATVNEIILDIEVPSVETLKNFINAFTKLAAKAEQEAYVFPTRWREIPLVSTDTSLDAFVHRTSIGKLVVINLNKLVYPYITERVHVPSQLQGTLVGAAGASGQSVITFTDVTKQTGTTDIGPGSVITITNNAKHQKDLKQQKAVIDWYSEATKSLRLKTPLLFEIDSSIVLQIYQYTANQVLSPGEQIKIPK